MLRDIIATLRAYRWGVAGVIVLTGIAAAQTAVDQGVMPGLPVGFKLAAWIWQLITLVAIGVMAFIAVHKARLERDKFQTQLVASLTQVDVPRIEQHGNPPAAVASPDPAKEKFEELRLNLRYQLGSELARAAILRYRKISNLTELEHLEGEFGEWLKRVQRGLDFLLPGLGASFLIPDNLPYTPIGGSYNRVHNQSRQYMDWYIKRLRHILERPHW